MSEIRAQVRPVGYPARLAGAWAAARAPRTIGAPTFVSTFAGCGGSSLGYAMAGYRELLAVEADRDACAAFRANFPGVPVHEGDIKALSGEAALAAAGVAPGELSVLDGSPPCQGFSASGKRRPGDLRNQLYHEFVRLLAAFRPRACVMENVPGMASAKMALFLRDATASIAAAGYRVRVWRLDAARFGVPQRRTRLIWIGTRDDLPTAPSPPAPGAARAVTVREAWRDLPECEPGPALRGKGAIVAALIPQGGHNSSGRYSRRITGTTSWFNTFRLAWNRPSRTLAASWGDPAFQGVVHPNENRKPSIAEGKRLQSFPDEFALPADYAVAWRLIGNSVPPLMMESVAAHVARLVDGSGGSPGLPRGP